MWRGFFYYSRTERRSAIMLLLAIGVLGIAVDVCKPLFAVASVPEKDEDCYAAFAGLMKQEEEDAEGHAASVGGQTACRAASEIASFDPNQADSAGLAALGLSALAVRSVLKYRARGGVFHSAESFGQIYGLTQADYKRLQPFVSIAEDVHPAEAVVRQAELAPHEDTNVPAKSVKYPEETVVDLNRADTAELQKIPGIGTVRARQIVDYRNRLGGFYSTRQLLEIGGMPSGVLRWFTLSRQPVKAIRLNHWNVERLQQHPYLNAGQAQAVVEYRHKFGPLRSLEPLTLYRVFTKDDLQRLAHYVDLN